MYKAFTNNQLEYGFCSDFGRLSFSKDWTVQFSQGCYGIQTGLTIGTGLKEEVD